MKYHIQHRIGIISAEVEGCNIRPSHIQLYDESGIIVLAYPKEVIKSVYFMTEDEPSVLTWVYGHEKTDSGDSLTEQVV